MDVIVMLGNRLSGRLIHDQITNMFDFEYDQTWLDWRGRFAITPNLPLVENEEISIELKSSIVRQFFENLLPEGRALDDASIFHQISKSNVMGLVIALGREAAGAISIKVTENDRDDESILRPISFAELSFKINNRPHLPFSVWDGKIRMSIAGYQDKVATYKDGDNWYLVEGRRYASTHIMKPEPLSNQLRHLTSNEYFCMRLAAKIKLPVAPASLIHVPEPVLVIERFDRIVSESGVERLHVIDGCQALGLSPGLKYERPYGSAPDVSSIRDGASLKKLFGMIRENSPMLSHQNMRLLRITIFNVLIGNVDAHAKNVSFNLNSSGLSLAPAYDLVCGQAFHAENSLIDNTYAMAIGDAFTSEDLCSYEWANFAKECKLQAKIVSSMINQVSTSILNVIDGVMREAIDAGANEDHLKKILIIIKDECARHLEFSSKIKEVHPSML